MQFQSAAILAAITMDGCKPAKALFCGAGTFLITKDSNWLCVYQLAVSCDAPQLSLAAQLPFPEPDNENQSAELLIAIWADDASVVLLAIQKTWWKEPECRERRVDDAEVGLHSTKPASAACQGASSSVMLMLMTCTW